MATKVKKKKIIIRTGRPSSYEGLLTIRRALKYLDKSTPERVQRIKSQSNTSTSYVYSINPNLPTIAGLALYLGVSRSTLYEWKKAHDDFSDTLERLLAIQEESLVNYGLSGEFNSTIVKLLLTSNHGYTEKKEIKLENASSVFDDDDDE